jgi:hypothetical protein
MVARIKHAVIGAAFTLGVGSVALQPGWTEELGASQTTALASSEELGSIMEERPRPMSVSAPKEPRREMKEKRAAPVGVKKAAEPEKKHGLRQEKTEKSLGKEQKPHREGRGQKGQHGKTGGPDRR